jgi:hypothetical protein
LLAFSFALPVLLSLVPSSLLSLLSLLASYVSYLLLLPHCH